MRTRDNRGSYLLSATRVIYMIPGTRTHLDCGRKEGQDESGEKSLTAFGANGSVPMVSSGTHDRSGESVLVISE